MVTLIIPTLWKSKRFIPMLHQYMDCPTVGEIVIIDNNRKFFEHFKEVHPKITLIQPIENIYVNPAWNVGVSVSKFDNITLVNDDVTFDINIFEYFVKSNLYNRGIIGLSTNSYRLNSNQDMTLTPYNTQPEWEWGWGCMIFLKKDMWIPIPSNLKIWFGDNFMRDINPTQCWILDGLKVESEVSTTSASREFVPLTSLDQINYNNLLKYGKVNNS